MVTENMILSNTGNGFYVFLLFQIPIAGDLNEHHNSA
jgi:hypothetical protein